MNPYPTLERFRGLVRSNFPVPAVDLTGDQLWVVRTYQERGVSTAGFWTVWCERGPLQVLRNPTFHPQTQKKLSRKVWVVGANVFLLRACPERERLREWVREAGLEDLRAPSRREALAVIQDALVRHPL